MLVFILWSVTMFTVGHNYVKDCMLVLSLLVAVCGGYYAYVQQNQSQAQLAKVMSDLNTLQKAEDNLIDLQNQ